MPGGWTYQPYLTPRDSFVFYNAIGSHDDYFYVPVATAKQIVNGTNYKFVCIAEPKTEDLRPYFVVVDVYQPLRGDPNVTGKTFL